MILVFILLKLYSKALHKLIQNYLQLDVEKMAKMKKLLEILSNPQQRMPLDTLIKCEIVLEKIDFKRGDGSVPTTGAPHLPFKVNKISVSMAFSK